MPDVDVVRQAVHVDDDGDGHRRFGRRYGDAEKAEEQSLHVFRIEVSVEHAEIYLDRVEDELDGYEHREQVLAGDEPVDSYEEHD